jgi:hypothetical protein
LPKVGSIAVVRKTNTKVTAVLSILKRHSLRELELMEWTRRVGPEAASHKAAASDWRIRTWLLEVVGFGLLYVGFKLGAQAIWIAGFIALALCLYAMNRMLSESARARREIGAALGVTISRKFPPPPNTGPHYLAWCEKHGLKPYPFGPSEPPSKA